MITDRNDDSRMLREGEQFVESEFSVPTVVNDDEVEAREEFRGRDANELYLNSNG